MKTEKDMLNTTAALNMQGKKIKTFDNRKAYEDY